MQSKDRMLKIFVTGAGALLGQGILRSLKLAKRNWQIITGDPGTLSSGHWLGHKAYRIPMANDSSYRVAIEKILETEKIDIVLVGTDIELPIFAQAKKNLEERTKAKIVIASERLVEIANDKWLTAEALRQLNLPYPASALTSDRERILDLQKRFGFPLIAKPVDGARSVGFEIIRNQNRLDEICSYPNNLVVQEYLTDGQGEFTAGAIVYGGECQALVTLRRDLRDGNTFRAYRDSTTSCYDERLREIAVKIGVDGPSNFQFRIKNDEPVVFEINARFSGTTPLRAFYGFNEVEAVVDFVAFGKKINQGTLKEGIVMRTFSDIMISNQESLQLQNESWLASPQCEHYAFIP